MFQDTVNTATIAAGEDGNFSCTPSVQSEFAQFGVTLDGTPVSLFGGSPYWIGSISSVLFAPLAGHLASSATEGNVTYKNRLITGYKNLYCWISANDRDGTSTFLLRDDGANSALTLDIAASTTGAFSDEVNEPAVAVGSLVCYQLTPGGSAGSLALNVSACEGIGDNVCTFFSGGPAAQWPTANPFRPMNGAHVGSQLGQSNAETEVRGDDFTCKNAFVRVTSSSGAADADLTLQKNASDTSVVVILPEDTTGLFEDLVNTADFTSGDDMNWENNRSVNETISATLYGVEYDYAAADQPGSHIASQLLASGVI